MTAPRDDSNVEAARPRQGFPWLQLAGSLACIAILVWYLSDMDWQAIVATVSRANPWYLAATIPLLFVSMVFRALRWRSLLGPAREVPFWSTFSAQMIGYLANNVLPIRLGDLVRVYVLGNMLPISRSRILSTVLLERLLDMAMVVLLLAAAATISPLPAWMRNSSAAVALATFCGIGIVIVVAIAGDNAVRFLRTVFPMLPHAIMRRIERWTAEFSSGVQRFRNPGVVTAFLGGTIAIWVTEIIVVLAVGRAFSLSLSMLDAGVLMVFSVFSGLVPALPGQIGTFELAIVMGLEFVGRSTASALPFVLAWHILLLVGTSAMGLVCLFASGLPLMPRRFIDRITSST